VSLLVRYPDFRDASVIIINDIVIAPLKYNRLCCLLDNVEDKSPRQLVESDLYWL